MEVAVMSARSIIVLIAVIMVHRVICGNLSTIDPNFHRVLNKGQAIGQVIVEYHLVLLITVQNRGQSSLQVELHSLTQASILKIHMIVGIAGIIRKDILIGYGNIILHLNVNGTCIGDLQQGGVLGIALSNLSNVHDQVVAGIKTSRLTIGGNRRTCA